MKIILRPHLKIRLEQRKIPQNYPGKILARPESKYFDILTSHLIAVRQLEYNGKVRPMTVAYDIIDNEIQVITVHPITNQEINNRVQRRRWIKDEKN